MHPALLALAEGVSLCDDVRRDAPAFLSHHGHAKTASHCAAVAAEAARIAQMCAADVVRAELAGWLHDISAPVPNAARADLARALGLEVLPAEAALPMILHQKLSAVLAREIFGVHDPAVLDAIGCHTTLRASATTLDKIVFIADKIAWDQPDAPPYLQGVLAALEHSLDEAALCYLAYLWERRHTLPTIHPWMVEAYIELSTHVTAPGGT